MIHLRARTEFSFRRAYGKVEEIIEAAGSEACAITDDGTWGHVPFFQACQKVKVKPILGVEILVVNNALKRERQTGPRMALLAKNDIGLREVYKLTTRANTSERFYYQPRLDYDDINKVSRNLFVLSGANVDMVKVKPNVNFCLELVPGENHWNRNAIDLARGGYDLVVCADNYYPTTDDHELYNMTIFERDRISRTTPMHLATEDELTMLIPNVPEEAFVNTERIAADCNVTLPAAEVVTFLDPVPLFKQCKQGAKKRKLDLKDPVYAARLKHELHMIKKKGFENYFYVIADLVNHAKQQMFVGPARGSAAGSLVCYLIGITDVDPIVHGLMFERFIDVTREDLPDIDIDFPDSKRDMVYEYLEEQYGRVHVGRFGTINRFRPRSAIDEVAKAIGMPPWEARDLKGIMIERSSGDARAEQCVEDVFELFDLAKELLKKYPGLRAAAKLEGHARHTGRHAAGVAVCKQRMTHYCSVDRHGTVQIDKDNAEQLNIMKIDALGLRTLSILEDTLVAVGLPLDYLVDYQLGDVDAFAILNEDRVAGIFQFEGYALQALTRQMKVHNFNDIVAITSLARPGPLHCGAAIDFIERRTGKKKVKYHHPLAKELTRDTFGVVVYQEQVMAIGREMGKLSWEDVSQLRKAMSKSKGKEFFDGYWKKFKLGTDEHGIPEGQAKTIWDNLCTFGNWAFNKSHGVAYGLISYWCCVLKAHYPLEYARACLIHERDESSSVKLLRELVAAGYKFVPFDPQRSQLTWSVQDDMLIGGITGIKGIGPSKAQTVLNARKAKRKLTPGLQRAVANASTPYDDLHEAHNKWRSIYETPKKHGVKSGPVIDIVSIQDDGTFIFIGKLLEKNLRDLNEFGNVQKRGGKMVTHHNLFLNVMVEDDTDRILATVDRYKYLKYGKPIVETGKNGDWYLWKGKMRKGYRKIYVDIVRKLESDESSSK